MILAAGEGTRLQPLTHNFPKPLVPIANKPVMEHILFWLSSHGIREVVINTCTLAEQIEAYFQDGSSFGVKIHYSRENKLWGTAGSVRRASRHFSDTFLVIGGDDLSDVNLKKLIASHKKSKALATIGLKKVERTEQYGVAVLDEKGRILRFQEKPATQKALSNLANTGIYLFEPEIFSFIPEDEVADFGHQIFPLLLEKKIKFCGVPVEGYWMDVGSLTEYRESHWAVLSQRCKVALPGKQASPGIWIEESVSIHPGAKIHSPCLIGTGTVIEENARLSGYVVTGKKSHIGKNASLERVILWDNASVKKGANLDNCIVMPDDEIVTIS